MRTLRPYQNACLTCILDAVTEGKRRMLAHLATGGGKTVIFSELPKILKARRTMVIAHREELLTQAMGKLHDTGLAAQIEQGSNKASGGCPVIVASIQTLNRANRLQKFNPADFDLVIIDECHHAAAKSYLRVVDHFCHSIVIGFTATPYRSDNADLLEVFTDGVVFSMGLSELTEEGYLTPMQKIEHEVMDLSASEVFNAYSRLAGNRKTIIFCYDVDHAIEVSKYFNEHNVKSAHVYGGMSKEERAAALKSFSKNGVKVLANCNVLTEGYDEPSVECVMIARNTDSQGLYEQMIGRGLRPCDGKSYLKTIELVVMPDKAVAAKYCPAPAVISTQHYNRHWTLPSLRERLEEAFWVMVVLATLIGAWVAFGYATCQCGAQL